MKGPLAQKDFRSLWLGSTISLLGDQFYLVAVPWLVLQLTGSSLALGTVLMTTAVPRAVLMLAGGAVTDRVTPRRVLLASAMARMLLVAAVGALVYLHVARLWHLYILTFAFGVADAFSLPAGMAMIPAMVEPAKLGAANALMQSSQMIAQIAAPAPAGIVIRIWGVAAAMIVDAVSFLAVIGALLGLAPTAPAAQVAPASGAQDAPTPPRRGTLHQIAEGLRSVRADPALSALMVVSAALNLSVYGPIIVGLAVAAKFRFGSAAAFGTLISCLSGGVLVGILIGGRLKNPRRRGLQFIVMSALAGAELIAIGVWLHFVPVAILLALMGLGLGFVNVQFSTWVQTRVAPALMGRVMSVQMLAGIGLIPVSYAVGGALANWSLEGLYIVSGSFLIVASAAALTYRAARDID